MNNPFTKKYRVQFNFKSAYYFVSVPLLFVFTCSVLFYSCSEESENLNPQGQDKFEANQIEQMPSTLALYDTTYVPIYSDIYSETKQTRFNLTATLSLRNTSFKNKIYISEVDYYNSAGTKTKSFLNNPIVLDPMQSIEYIIEEDDISGGTGANFVITWGANNNSVDPIFEGIMISTHGQQGISFSTKGVSISNK